jgi:hypothetical protein
MVASVSAAASDEVVEEAALPFDPRPRGMIISMGAAALVVESADASRLGTILTKLWILRQAKGGKGPLHVKQGRWSHATGRPSPDKN